VKRSFKLATVFTGVGAVTGVFGPMAFAAPANAAVVKPDINPAKVCGANNGGVSKWVHLFYPNNDHPAECIEGAGSELLKGAIASFCPGYNNGILGGTVDGVYEPFRFHDYSPRLPVSRYDLYRGYFDVESIHISNWSGANKCT